MLLVTGAPITPGMATHLRELTGVARISEAAGATEGVLAMSCAEGRGLHVAPDTCYVEALDRETRRPVAPRSRGTMVHCFLIPEGSVYLRYDSEDVVTIDDDPCPCGLPSPRIKIVGRWEHSFRFGRETLVPYDVQLALEEEVPQTVGMPFVISREGLDAGQASPARARPRARRGGASPSGCEPVSKRASASRARSPGCASCRSR